MSKKKTEQQQQQEDLRNVNLGEMLGLSTLPRLSQKLSVPKILNSDGSKFDLDTKIQDRLCQGVGGELINVLRKHAIATGVSEFLIRLSGDIEQNNITKVKELRLSVDSFPISVEVKQDLMQQNFLSTLVARDLNSVLAFIHQQLPKAAESFVQSLPPERRDNFNPVELFLYVLMQHAASQQTLVEPPLITDAIEHLEATTFDNKEATAIALLIKAYREIVRLKAPQEVKEAEPEDTTVEPENETTV